MYVKVRALAGQKKEEIKEIGENRLEIRVKEPAERNLANNRIIEILSSYFGVSVKGVRIISGHHHPSKIFSVENADN